MYNTATYPVRVTAGAFQVLGLIFTAWRIYFRIRIGRFWWEDAWAVVAFFSCIVAVGGEWIYLLTYGVQSTVGFWLNSLGFTSIVRAVHMSILFSIIRIIRASPLLRKFTHACVVFIALCWAILVIGKTWQCASDSSWHRSKPPACPVIQELLIFEFISDCIVVSILIALPLRMLWNVKLPRRQRRMILSIFASSIILAFAAAFHVVGHLTGNGRVMTAGINFEVAFSIIVCNLLVIVTFVYRFLLDEDSSSASRYCTSSETDDFTQARVPTSERTTLTMTTVMEMDSGLTTTSGYLYTDRSPQTASVSRHMG